jgi:hypothetical protein
VKSLVGSASVSTTTSTYVAGERHEHKRARMGAATASAVAERGLIDQHASESRGLDALGLRRMRS